jgi:hypothetical protein
MVPPLSPAERQREARARRRRAIRQYLIVGLCFVALLGLGGVAVGFLFYDRATKPDLSTPSLVTRKYLSAYLVNRDDAAAAQYQCEDTSGLEPMRAFRADLDDREKKYNLNISVSVDSVRETSRSGDQAEVAADTVVSAVDAGTQLSRVQHWAITTRNESGWRVCAAHEVQ